MKDPERYGVAEISGGKLISIEEKPVRPKSNIAITGLYFYDNEVVEIAKDLKPSGRGELEITDINRVYLERGEAYIEIMGRGFTWLDAGTYTSLMQANHFVQVIEERQGQYIAAIEEIAYGQGFITKEQLLKNAAGDGPYSRYLRELA